MHSGKGHRPSGATSCGAGWRLGGIPVKRTVQVQMLSLADVASMWPALASTGQTCRTAPINSGMLKIRYAKRKCAEHGVR